MPAQEQIQAVSSTVGRLDGQVLRIASVVILGSIMAILDTTVINVALQTLTLEFHTSFDTIQWVATGYMLALATVVPITGWASDRFGTKRVYLLAITGFLVGSVLAGLAWDVRSLIVFRVVQGFGGGLLMPAGMAILTRAAGPDRIGRVMALLGIPMLLGPIGGPILGGWLVDAVSWRWIFYINVPIGVVAFVLASRFLPAQSAAPAEKLDVVGLLLLSPGLAALIYGISNVPGPQGLGSVAVWLPSTAGVVLIGGFVARALRIDHPLIDLRLFLDRAFSRSVVTMALFSLVFFGATLVLPLYFLLVRGESAMSTGLLLVPQGLGAMVAMPVTGRIADRRGARTIVLTGLVLLAASLAVLTRVGPSTPYALLLPVLFLSGIGLGSTMTTIMSAALQTLTSKAVTKASSALNIIQQTAGALGTAVLSVVLAALLAGRFGVPTSEGQVAATAALRDPVTHDHAADLASGSFGTTFLVALVMIGVCFAAALLLPRRRVEV